MGDYKQNWPEHKSRRESDSRIKRWRQSSISAVGVSDLLTLSAASKTRGKYNIMFKLLKDIQGWNSTDVKFILQPARKIKTEGGKSDEEMEEWRKRGRDEEREKWMTRRRNRGRREEIGRRRRNTQDVTRLNFWWGNVKMKRNTKQRQGKQDPGPVCGTNTRRKQVRISCITSLLYIRLLVFLLSLNAGLLWFSLTITQTSFLYLIGWWEQITREYHIFWACHLFHEIRWQQIPLELSMEISIPSEDLKSAAKRRYSHRIPTCCRRGEIRRPGEVN